MTLGRHRPLVTGAVLVVLITACGRRETATPDSTPPLVSTTTTLERVEAAVDQAGTATTRSTTTTTAPAEASPHLPDVDAAIDEFDDLVGVLDQLDDLLADLATEWAETEGDVSP